MGIWNSEATPPIAECMIHNTVYHTYLQQAIEDVGAWERVGESMFAIRNPETQRQSRYCSVPVEDGGEHAEVESPNREIKIDFSPPTISCRSLWDGAMLGVVRWSGCHSSVGLTGACARCVEWLVGCLCSLRRPPRPEGGGRRIFFR